MSSWVYKVTARCRRVAKVSLSHLGDSVSSLILNKIFRLLKGC